MNFTIFDQTRDAYSFPHNESVFLGDLIDTAKIVIKLKFARNTNLSINHSTNAMITFPNITSVTIIKAITSRAPALICTS